MMEHYIGSIKSHGTADGYNTEIPEWLHIDLSKVSYHTSNHKDYIIQMTKWIARHEKLHAFKAYIRWCDPQFTGIDDTKEEDFLEGTESQGSEEDEVDDVADHDQVPGLTYHVSKRPGFPNTPVLKIMWDFGATNFIPILSAFLKHKFPKYRTPINEMTLFDLYKCMVITLESIQQIEQSTIQDHICATPFVPHNSQTVEKPAHFDTVLIHFNQKAQETSALGEQIHIIQGKPILMSVRISHCPHACNLSPSRSAGNRLSSPNCLH